MIHCRNGVLPDQFFSRHFRAEVTNTWTHIAVREFEPSTRKSIRELIRILVETTRHLLVGRVHTKRDIGGEHDGRVFLCRHVCIGNGVRSGIALGLPLLSTGRALGQLPLVSE